MREILFRGKPIVCEELMEPNETLKEFFERQQGWSAYSVNEAFTDDGFAIGQVVYSHVKAWIVGEVMEAEEDYIALEYWVPVKPETVGQYTGLRDKNGVKIFEGDICKYRYGASTYVGKVVFNTHACIFEIRRTAIVGYHGERAIKTQLLNHIDKVEVIGNVHENPELLEVKL